jgi:hypothetical protein
VVALLPSFSDQAWFHDYASHGDIEFGTGSDSAILRHIVENRRRERVRNLDISEDPGNAGLYRNWRRDYRTNLFRNPLGESWG